MSTTFGLGGSAANGSCERSRAIKEEEAGRHDAILEDKIFTAEGTVARERPRKITLFFSVPSVFSVVKMSFNAYAIFANLRGRPFGSHSTTYRSPGRVDRQGVRRGELFGMPSISSFFTPAPSPSRATTLSFASMIDTRAPSSGT